MAKSKIDFTTWGWTHVGIKLNNSKTDGGGEFLTVSCPEITGLDWSVDMGKEPIFGCRGETIGVGEGNVAVTGSLRLRPQGWWGNRTDDAVDSSGFIPAFRRQGHYDLQSLPPYDVVIAFGDQIAGDGGQDFHEVTIVNMVFSSMDSPHSIGDTSFEISMDFIAKDIIEADGTNNFRMLAVGG